MRKTSHNYTIDMLERAWSESFEEYEDEWRGNKYRKQLSDAIKIISKRSLYLDRDKV